MEPAAVTSAPRAGAPSPGLLPILGGGLLTTAAALGLVWLLNGAFPEFNIMGWYWWYILPIGALLVGGVAGSGYGLGSWLSGSRTTGALVFLVLNLQVGAYFAAQYLEFHSLDLQFEDGSKVGFWTYFDILTRAFAFKSKSGGDGNPLGGMGYAIRILEILGFGCGGMIVPMILWKAPYCERCRRYKKDRELASVIATAGPSKAKRGDVEAQKEALRAEAQARDSASGAIDAAVKTAVAGEADAFGATVSALAKNSKAARKAKRHYRLGLIYCPICREGDLTVAILESDGKNSSREELGSTRISPAMVEEAVKRAS